MGQNKVVERYHYKTCGLDNIYLIGPGVQIKESKYGKTVSIHNMDQLHRLIAEDIATSSMELSGQELRFLRIQLDLSQAQFAELIGSTKQNIGRYERGEVENGIPGSVQMSARMFYLACIQKSDIAKIVKSIAELDRKMHGDRVFRSDGDGWDAGAKNCAN